jgi:hypothetical protein
MSATGKICHESIFRDSQAPVQTSNLAFTVPLLSFHERWTIAVEVKNLLMRKKCVKSELPHVRFRDSE